jgi:hypothetical protein
MGIISSLFGSRIECHSLLETSISTTLGRAAALWRLYETAHTATKSKDDHT